MNYKVLNVNHLHEAVELAMRELNKAPVVNGENQDQMDELKELSLVINIENTKDITISKALPSDLYMLVEYELEFIEGVRDFEKSWDYTYHQLYSHFYDECIEELKRNKCTRRAVLPLAGERSYGSPHPPCMQIIMFKITDNKLDATVVFRSNDGVKAFAMNSFAIARLINKMASELGVEPGSYTHIAQSFHAYKKDWTVLDSYCRLFESRNDCFYTLDEYLEVYDEYADEYRKSCKAREASV